MQAMLIFMLGKVSNKLAQASKVAPVVSTSSINKICLLAKLAGCAISKTSFTFSSQRPDLTITATDVTQTSVAVATKNSVDLGLANRVNVIDRKSVV